VSMGSTSFADNCHEANLAFGRGVSHKIKNFDEHERILISYKFFHIKC